MAEEPTPTDRMVYSPEFPDGKEESFTAEEKTAREAKAVRVAEEYAVHITKTEKEVADTLSGNQKLKDLGLTDDEITALFSGE